MNDDTLREAKTRLRTKYIGQCGIHGVGIRESRNAVCLYLELAGSPEQEETLREAAEDALPFELLTVEAPPARIM